MTIMGSNNSKVCNNKAFGNMFRMYTLGVWSGHMLQDKETLCSVLLGFWQFLCSVLLACGRLGV